MAIKTGKELAAACVDVAKNYKTLYVMGCFGAPMTTTNKKRWIEREHYGYNNKAARTKMINAASSDTFGFDCVNLIKALLWGWNGDVNHVYGGVKYQSNGVPDINADQMIDVCKDVSTDFSGIQVGEVVWLKGHIGVYIGDGLVVECSPKWANKVQITAVQNIGAKAGYNARTWTNHGKLPYVEYVTEEAPKLEVDGKWGKATTTRLQQIFGTTVDGKVSNQIKKYKKENPGLTGGWEWKLIPNGKGSQLIKAMQKWAGMPEKDQDGEMGPKTIKAIQTKLGTKVDGYVSYPSKMVKALQEWANEQ